MILVCRALARRQSESCYCSPGDGEGEADPKAPFTLERIIPDSNRPGFVTVPDSKGKSPRIQVPFTVEPIVPDS